MQFSSLNSSAETAIVLVLGARTLVRYTRGSFLGSPPQLLGVDVLPIQERSLRRHTDAGGVPALLYHMLSSISLKHA